MTRMRLGSAVTLLALLALAGTAWSADRTPSPPGAEVYFIGLSDHAKVHSPLVVRFGLKGMGVAPAGTVMENTGHHHLFIDTPLPTDMSQPIPAIEGKVIHYGKGQTEAELTLAPGEHTLQLLLGDAKHVPHEPPVASKKLTITVLK